MMSRVSNPATSAETIGTGPSFDLAIAARTDVGCVRTLNEDSVHCVVPSDATLRHARGALAIVADGMGGHAAGEVASQMAIEVVARAYFASSEHPREGLVDAFHQANARIFESAQSTAQLQGMGTTCCALVICHDAAFSANVGDSRLYLVRGGQIYVMTSDDSAVQDMVARGLLTSGEARHHADRNVILRALGTHDRVAVAAWVKPLPVRRGDVFVLCSDGLHDQLDDHEIRDVVIDRDVTEASVELIARARARGGPDNISVIVIRLQDAGAPLGDDTRPVDDVTRRTAVRS